MKTRLFMLELDLKVIHNSSYKYSLEGNSIHPSTITSYVVVLPIECEREPPSFFLSPFGIHLLHHLYGIWTQKTRITLPWVTCRGPLPSKTNTKVSLSYSILCVNINNHSLHVLLCHLLANFFLIYIACMLNNHVCLV